MVGFWRSGMAFVLVLVLGLIIAVPYPVASQAGVYNEDFEDERADGWELGLGWQVVLDGDNHVLRGEGHDFAIFRGVDQVVGDIESFEFRYQLPGGSAHIVFRLSGKGSRYFIRLEQTSVALHKTVLKNPPPAEGDLYDHPVLIRQPASPGGDPWHTLQITGSDNQITVHLDGQLALNYTDQEDPYLSGGVAFETLDDTAPTMLVDDIILKGPPVKSDPGDLNWVFTGGPRGGIGYDIRIDPLDDQLIWVTDAYAGVHQSLDGGQSWSAKNQGIQARTGFSGDATPIFSLTIDPNHPNILWTGTQGMRGVYKSVDGGETWQEMDQGIAAQPNMEFRGFTVDPTDSNTVYCGGNYLVDPEKSTQRGFIYKTIDGGENWKLLLEPTALVRWIIVDPTDHNIVYASTGIFDRFAVKPVGVLKSYDGGLSWEQVNDGFTSLAVGALAMHPSDPLTLLAGTGKAGYFVDEPGEIYGGVFKTTDGGKHWRQVDPLGASRGETRFSAVAFAPSNPKIVYADTGGLFLRSEDGGEHWQVYHTGPESGAASGENRGQPIALAVHPKDPNWLYMNAYDGGVFISQDGGRTWKDASRGYSGAQAWSIDVHPSDPAMAAVASKNGIHITKDGGQTWQGLITDGQLNNLTSTAFDPATPATILLGTEIDGSIWKTRDGGKNWRRASGPLGEDIPGGRRTIYRIAYAPSNPKTVFAATGIDTLTVHIPDETTGTGVLKSMDGGNSWEQVNRGLEGANFNSLDLAIHPQDEKIVYLGTLTGGVYKTVDGGITWSPAKQGLQAKEIRSIAIDPYHPETVFAGTGGSGIWCSKDEGASWAQISIGLPPEASIFSMVFDPAQQGVVYAADRFSGVYASRDAGETWIRINNGLQMRAVNKLAISENGKHLYAATEGNGVYRLDIDGMQPQPAYSPTAIQEPSTTPTTSSSAAGSATAPQPEETSISPIPTATIEQRAISSSWPFYLGVLSIFGMIVVLLFKRKN